MRKAATTPDVDQIDRLEAKVKQLISMVDQLRTDRTRTDAENVRLAQELEEAQASIADAAGTSDEVSALRAERAASHRDVEGRIQPPRAEGWNGDREGRRAKRDAEEPAPAGGAPDVHDQSSTDARPNAPGELPGEVLEEAVLALVSDQGVEIPIPVHVAEREGSGRAEIHREARRRGGGEDPEAVIQVEKLMEVI